MSMYMCPKCGSQLMESANFCQHCGSNIEFDFIEHPVCPKCLKEFPAGTKFCDVDGTKLVSADKMVSKCPICKKQYPADIKFCPDDGGQTFTYVKQPGQLFSDTSSGTNYQKASLGNRFLASILDFLIVLGLAIPAIFFYILGIAQLASYSHSGGSVIMFLLAILLYIIPVAYSFIKDGLGEGQSWGKKTMGIMVVYLPDNTPCTKGQSCLRGLIGVLLNFVPFVGWLIEPVMVLANEDGRRLADKAANTQVIDKDAYNRLT